MKTIGYESISTVLEIWDEARYGPKNQDFSLFGMLTLKRLFKIQPEAKSVFGFEKGEDHGMAQTSIHARALADLFDSVFQMLGPDDEFMAEILEQVGKRHKSRGVSPSLFPFMGQALVATLEEYVGRKLTHEENIAWDNVYEALSDEILKAMIQE